MSEMTARSTGNSEAYSPLQRRLKRHCRTLAHRGVLFLDEFPEFARQGQALARRIGVVLPGRHDSGEAVGLAGADTRREETTGEVALLGLLHPGHRAHLADHETLLGNLEEEHAGLGPAFTNDA